MNTTKQSYTVTLHYRSDVCHCIPLMLLIIAHPFHCNSTVWQRLEPRLTAILTSRRTIRRAELRETKIRSLRSGDLPFESMMNSYLYNEESIHFDMFCLAEFPHHTIFLEFPSIKTFLADDRSDYSEVLYDLLPIALKDCLAWHAQYQSDLASLIPDHIINSITDNDAQPLDPARLLTRPTIFFGHRDSPWLQCYPNVLASRTKTLESCETVQTQRDEHGKLDALGFKALWGDLVFFEEAHRTAEAVFACLDQAKLRSLANARGFSTGPDRKGPVSMAAMIRLGKVFLCECCHPGTRYQKTWDELVSLIPFTFFSLVRLLTASDLFRRSCIT